MSGICSAHRHHEPNCPRCLVMDDPLVAVLQDNDQLRREVEFLKYRDKRRRSEVYWLNAALHDRNVALDALHMVWCSGGCPSGVHRYVPGVVTEEIVEAAERNTRRLRAWFTNDRGRVLRRTNQLEAQKE